MSTPTGSVANLSDLKIWHRGKVRDVYEFDESHFLMVASDRLSAYDVILPDVIPDKGRILTQVSNFWFRQLQDLVPNHLVDTEIWQRFERAEDRAWLRGRAVLVKRLRALPVEAIVRGYLIGSGWREYQQLGSVSAVELPSGLSQAAKLVAPIFTPSSKAEVGDHDVNISFAEVERMLGRARAEEIREVSLAIYSRAEAYAGRRGIIIADTKFEFGLDDDDQLVLMDEVLTPDSSRFWPAEQYQTGVSPPSFDKQFVRDYLDGLDWDKTPPGPRLPADIIAQTEAKYRRAASLLIEGDSHHAQD